MKNTIKAYCNVKIIIGLLFVCSGLCQFTFATVTITKPTGGVGLSADKAANGTAPAWSNLGSIVIREQNSTVGRRDFAASQTNVSLILSAPASWEFNPGVGLVTYTAARDITAASISVSSSAATVTFTTDSSATTQDIMTISGLQVRPISGKSPPKLEYIMRTSANPGTAATIPGVTLSSTQFANLSIVTGAINKLVVVMPGQSFTSGVGVSGTPTTQNSGVSFVITKLYGTDQFFNIQNTYAGTKTLTWAGPLGTNTYTTSVAFTAGASTTTLTTTIRQSQTTALAARNGTLYANTGSTFTVGNPIITIGSPSSQAVPSIMSDTFPQDAIMISSGSANYFYVDDQKGVDAGYYTTLSCTNLVSGSYSIPNSNISVSTDGTIDLIAGTSNPRVTSDINTAYQACNNTLTFLRRNTAANSSVMGKYGQFLNIKVTVPPRQQPANYSSTITFTLIEN